MASTKTPSITKPVIDVDKTLDEEIKREAANMEMRAALAEIEARQYEILDDLQPGREDVEAWRERFGDIAANRRRRADGLLKRSGVKSVLELPGIEMLVPMIAANLADAQRRQVLLDEKETHLDLYALSPEEAQIESMRADPNVPPPENAEQIKLNAAQGRAHLKATTEWLEAHKPKELVDASDPIRQRGVDAARKFFNMPEPEDTSTEGE